MADKPINLQKPKLLGKNYQTPDIAAKVTGRARYAEDYRAEGMLFAKVLLSPLPHARIKIQWEPLPFCVDALQSLRPDGPNARTEGNVHFGDGLKTYKWTAEDWRVDRGLTANV